MKKKWKNAVVFCLVFSMLLGSQDVSAYINIHKQQIMETTTDSTVQNTNNTVTAQKKRTDSNVNAALSKEAKTIQSSEQTDTQNTDVVGDPVQKKKTTLKKAENSAIEYGTDDGISRAAWIHDLAVIFDMTVEEDNYPDVYYPDVTEDMTYFRDIMMGIEFGLIDTPMGQNFEPDTAVDREFAAHTLNYCLKYQAENESYSFSDADDITYQDDAQVALEKNWFASIDGAFCPAQKVTKTEVTKMLTDAQKIYASTEVDSSYKNSYTFAEDVVEVPETANVELKETDSETTITIEDDSVDIQEGTRFVVYQNQIPLGYEAETVETSDGQLVVKAMKLDSDDVVVDVDAEGSVQADLGDLTPAEGVRLTPVYDTNQKAAKQSAKSNKGAGVGIQQQKFNVNIPLTSGATLKASGTLYDLRLDWKNIGAEKSIVLTGNAQVNYTANLSGNDLAAIPSSINLCYLDILGVGSFTISLDASISGSVGCSYVTKFTTGIQYTKGSGFRVVSSFHKEKFSFHLDATTTISMTAALSAKDIPKFTARIYATAGIVSKSMLDIYTDGNKPTKCQHFASYMYAETGGKMEIKHVKSWSTKHVIWDADNSPVRTEQHYEDGVGVNKCTRNARKYCSIWSKMKWGMACPKDASGIWLDEQGEPVPVFTYTLDALGNATITGYTANPGVMVIPEKVDEHPVVAVGKEAFKNKTNLISVILPEGIETLEQSCFEGCRGITAINIPDSVTEMGENVFMNCSGLYEVTLPVNKKYTEIGKYIFKGTSSLHTVNMSPYITKIDEEAFCNSGLESLDLPDDITFIGYKAFFGCKQLKTLHLPEYLEVFGGCAFGDCDSLTSVTIPKRVKENEYYPDYHYFADNDLEGGLFKYCDSLTEVTFEDGTKTIGHNVLNGCTGLKKVNIPDTVTCIGMHAFNACKSLEEIALPESLTEIDALAFRGTGLKKIEIPDGVVKIDCLAFAVCDELSEVKMPNNLQEIGTWAFATCPKLKDITIPKGTKTVLNYYNGWTTNTTQSPFVNCDALQNVTLENGMKIVANCLFDEHAALKKIVIPDTVTTIGKYCFYNAVNLEDVTLSKNLYEIGDKAFSQCTSLEKIVLPDTVGSMGASVFANCTLLSDVTLPKYRLNITNYTFENCTSLKQITLPDNVQYIRNGAFKGCERLESITTPDNFIGIDYEAFKDCKRLETVKFTGKWIEKNAFEGCQELTNIEFVGNVTDIRQYAFKNCSSLTSIKLANGMTKIYEGTFDGCSVLNNVVVPYTVTTIDKNAFANCVSLAKITIPKSVTTMADSVFSYPDKLTIYGVEGSYAEEYADKQGIAFNPINVSAQSIKLSQSIYNTYCNLGGFYIPHTITPDNMTDDVTWKSSDEEVAKVDEKGYVNSINPGTCTIEVTAGSAKAKCTLVVASQVYDMSITGKSTLTVGEKEQLEYTLNQGTIPAGEVRWMSHDASVVSVDENGNITANAKGEAVIEAYWIRKTDDVKAQLTIKVKENASNTPTPTASSGAITTPGTKPSPTGSVNPTETASAKPSPTGSATPSQTASIEPDVTTSPSPSAQPTQSAGYYMEGSFTGWGGEDAYPSSKGHGQDSGDRNFYDVSLTNMVVGKGYDCGMELMNPYNDLFTGADNEMAVFIKKMKTPAIRITLKNGGTASAWNWHTELNLPSGEETILSEEYLSSGYFALFGNDDTIIKVEIYDKGESSDPSPSKSATPRQTATVKPTSSVPSVSTDQPAPEQPSGSPIPSASYETKTSATPIPSASAKAAKTEYRVNIDDDDDDISAPAKPGKVKIKKASAMKNGKVKLTWKKPARAKWYIIQYSTKRNFAGAKIGMVYGKKTTLRLKKNRTYYIRIRAYAYGNSANNNRAVKGKWSKVKRVRTRK